MRPTAASRLQTEGNVSYDSTAAVGWCSNLLAEGHHSVVFFDQGCISGCAFHISLSAYTRNRWCIDCTFCFKNTNFSVVSVGWGQCICRYMNGHAPLPHRGPAQSLQAPPWMASSPSCGLDCPSLPPTLLRIMYTCEEPNEATHAQHRRTSSASLHPDYTHRYADGRWMV